jgi:hypothetical protein
MSSVATAFRRGIKTFRRARPVLQRTLCKSGMPLSTPSQKARWRGTPLLLSLMPRRWMNQLCGESRENSIRSRRHSSFRRKMISNVLRYLPQPRPRIRAAKWAGSPTWEDRNSRQVARPVPSLRYVLNRTPIWNKEFIANPVERILEGEEPPTGGSLGTAVSTLSTNRPPSLWPPTRWPTLDRRKQVRMPMTFEDSSDQTSSMIPPGLCRDAHCDRALRAGGR